MEYLDFCGFGIKKMGRKEKSVNTTAAPTTRATSIITKRTYTRQNTNKIISNESNESKPISMIQHVNTNQNNIDNTVRYIKIRFYYFVENILTFYFSQYFNHILFH